MFLQPKQWRKAVPPDLAANSALTLCAGAERIPWHEFCTFDATPLSARIPHESLQMNVNPTPGLNIVPATGLGVEPAARALHALAGGVTSYIYASPMLAARRTAAIQMSFWLRQAFSVRPTDLTPIPLQLGADFNVARDFMATQADRWAASDSFSELFDAAKLAEPQAKAITGFLPSLLPLDHGALWLAREFGEIGAQREADHCRRYVAAWMTRAILGEAGQPAPIGRQSADNLQTRLDGWANPVTGVESSLHFERVIQPMLRRLAEIARLAGAASPNFAANDHSERP